VNEGGSCNGQLRSATGCWRFGGSFFTTVVLFFLPVVFRFVGCRLFCHRRAFVFVGLRRVVFVVLFEQRLDGFRLLTFLRWL